MAQKRTPNQRSVTHSPWSDRQRKFIYLDEKYIQYSGAVWRTSQKLRLQSGLSQEAFADKCGLDRTYVSGIERGVRNPTLEVISVLGKGLDMDIKRIIQL